MCSFVQSLSRCLWSACYRQSPGGEAWHSTRDFLQPGRPLSLPNHNPYVYTQSETALMGDGVQKTQQGQDRMERRVASFVDSWVKVHPIHRVPELDQSSFSPGSTGQQPWQAAVATVSLGGVWHHSSSHKRRGQASMA